VEGGSANDYDYTSGDPVNNEDLDGTAYSGKNIGRNQAWYCKFHWKRCATTLNSLRARAESATSSMAKEFGWDAGQANAFRHGYWMAMIAKRYGKGWAVGLGKAHEADTPRKYRDDSRVDLHNNPIGAAYGVEHDNWSDARLADGLAAIVSRREGGYDY
jgi:hypothetical protein